MARLFNPSLSIDYLQSSSTLNLSSYNKLSLSFWLYWDSFANNDNEALELGASGVLTVGGFSINPNDASNNGGGKFGFGPQAGSGGYQYATFTRPSAAVWHHYLFTMDITGTSGLVAYVDNVSQSLTYALNSTPTGNFGNLTLNFMSRNGSSLFGSGRMAEVALWPGIILPSDAIKSLAYGYEPKLIKLPSLGWYWPLMGNASPEIELIKGNNATVTGTSYIQHPTTLSPSPLTFENYNEIFNKSLTLAETAGFSLTPNNVVSVSDSFSETASFTLTPNNVVSVSNSYSETAVFTLALVTTFNTSNSFSETATFSLTPNNVVTVSDSESSTNTFFLTVGNVLSASNSFSETTTFSLTPNNVINLSDSELTTNSFSLSPNNVISLSNSYTETANFTLSPGNNINPNVNFNDTGGFTLIPNNVILTEIVLNRSPHVTFATRQPALKLYDRIKESSTSTGTGNFLLTGAQSGGYFAFATKLHIGEQFPYLIQNTSLNQFELGIGHLMTNTVLIRDQVQISSNNNNVVDFGSGNKDVLIPLPVFYAGVFQEAGDLVIVGTDGIPRRLEAGPEGSTLTIVNGMPQWV